jgi:ribosomal protein S18 acetylase RimI-like enzyme
LNAAVQFRRVDLAQDRDAVFAISLEYMRWVIAGIAADPRTAAVVPPLTESVEEYTAAGLEAVCGRAPPEGAFYLVECDGQVAGMCGWRRIADGVGELKRIYIKPTYRGRGLGEAILQRLLEDVGASGCHRIVLDTAPFMHAAQRLYEVTGFRDCEPYEGTEVPVEWHAVWRFMELANEPA